MMSVDREGQCWDDAGFCCDTHPNGTVGGRQHFPPPNDIQFGVYGGLINTVSDPATPSPCLQSKHQPGTIPGAATKPGPEAETTMPAVDQPDASFRKLERWIPDQGAISEQP